MFSFGGYLCRGIVNFQVTRRLPSFWFHVPESSSGCGAFTASIILRVNGFRLS
jgi:hypothetical protein